ncbi:MAG TPA: hydrogenase formation protein HypD [Syntrophales bacterium]|nr:hydrogenase formation protein HypD [Syntrophales bacterium]
MKYIDEYRDPALAKGLLDKIVKLSEQIKETVIIMEVCGSHTNAIGRFGFRGMMPENIRLISGPGCPVCVTSIHDVDVALHLASQKNVIFATFGDMLRVPGSQGKSLQKTRAAGADVRVVASAIDCVSLAQTHTDKEIIFMGIGFETTSPTIASTILTCKKRGIFNFSVFSVHKVIPPALQALIDDPALNINGFLCPGHVSTIIGTSAYELITEAGRAAVVTGFEPVDILEGIFMILNQIVEDRKTVAIQYSRGVKPEGNPRAREIMMSVFYPGDSEWRGLGSIPRSGLVIKEPYAAFDALKKFEVPEIHSVEMKGCCCGDILRGIKAPNECPLFKRVCTPLNPGGPCMVSSEGTCAAYYAYHQD